MYLRALEFSSQENEQPPKLESCSKIYYRLKNIAKPSSAGRNEDGFCQNRNSISLLYMRRIKCQVFALSGYPSFCGGFFFFNLADNSNSHIILATP